MKAASQHFSTITYLTYFVKVGSVPYEGPIRSIPYVVYVEITVENSCSISVRNCQC